jgi:hypothetical protein
MVAQIDSSMFWSTESGQTQLLQDGLCGSGPRERTGLTNW